MLQLPIPSKFVQNSGKQLKIIEKILGAFTKKHVAQPLLIIKKDITDSNIKEYNSIEEAITDLETDPNVPADKIEKLRASLKILKDKGSIKIRNGELL